MYKKTLIRKAKEAQENAYIPYSGFRVGAAVLMENGDMYTGCNIEIVSYSPTICAERTAIFKGISEGHRGIKAIAVVGDSDFTYPCGVCRQVIREFGENVNIIIANSEDDYKEYTLNELLPNSFVPEDLGRKDEDNV